MNKHKVRAFTLMEVTIAMLIAAIAIGIAYTAFVIINRSYQQYQQKHLKMAEALRLNELLIRDFTRSAAIENNEDEVEFVMPAFNTPVRYLFDDSSVVRFANRIDTFKVAIDSMSVSFVRNDTLTIVDKTTECVAGLRFRLQLDGRFIPYVYTKNYSSEELINYNADARD